MQINKKKLNFKRLSLFTLSSAALISSGYFLNAKADLIEFLILMICNANGIFLVYRLNDYVDQDADLKFNAKKFLQIRLHQIMVIQFTVFAIPLAFFYLDRFSFIILASAGAVGVLYSLSFQGKSKKFRLKNIFLVKNILIGLFWGSLVLIGSGLPNNKAVYPLFILVCIQVFIGSMIRDIPDVERDRSDKVNTFPIVLGIKNTFIFMHLVNIATIGLTLIAGWSQLILLVAVITAFWRSINLFAFSKNMTNNFWGQTINLLTCVLIFIVITVVVTYDLL